jgi:hypothetical protein
LNGQLEPARSDWELGLKIRRVVVHDPDNTVELACWHSGISGMKEYLIALRWGNLPLQREIRKLYALCSPGRELPD